MAVRSFVRADGRSLTTYFASSMRSMLVFVVQYEHRQQQQQHQPGE